MVIRTVLIKVPLILLLLLSACAKDKDEQKPEWKYGKDAIDITLHASQDLNLVNGHHNSLLIVIYQLKKINEFNRLAAYQEGLRKLLEAGVFDDSVMATKKVFIEPGGVRSLTLDRAEDARFVGIVAGYYHLIPARCSTVQDIQVEEERHGLFKIWSNPKISLLGIRLYLGRDGLRVENGQEPKKTDRSNKPEKSEKKEKPKKKEDAA